MSADERVVLEITRLEAAHLAMLVSQFADLLADADDAGSAAPDDPAIARLVPDGYADDLDAAREFRELTAGDLLRRRADDAGAVLRDLTVDGIVPDAGTLGEEGMLVRDVVLDRDALGAWLRTLAALRLVLAERLGIHEEDDHHDDDPRFGVYDWVGYRLDGLVTAADALL